MKTLGLIGGLSWYSTAIYYKTINQLVAERMGGSHSAKLLLYSVDFDEFRVLQEKDNWSEVEKMLSGIGKTLQEAGADCIVMCTNTPHLVADDIRAKLHIPLIHIAEETGKAIAKKGFKKVALTGTRFTMENSFFTDRLAQFGVASIVPDKTDRDFIHNSIFNELTRGMFTDATRDEYLAIIRRLSAAGAEGVIFGCTEISLLVDPSACKLPVFETATIHATAAVEFALAEA